MPIILPANTITGGYEVANSLRFNDGSSDYLTRTPSTSNRKTWTYSGWIKRGNLGLGNTSFFGTGTSGTEGGCHLLTDNLEVYDYVSGYNFQLVTNRKFRDSSAWYHIVLAVDTTQATSSNRVKLYVNGVQETSFSTASYPTLNLDTQFNYSSSTNIIGNIASSSAYWDGYMAEVCFIDGQQLDASSFGEFDEDSGIWKPIDVSGLTFGTNGFYLDFENSGSLGADVSGNGNNFTVNNLTSIDQTTDSPTNNFATYNSLANNQAATFSDGNLTETGNSTYYSFSISNIGFSTGKWYCEYKIATVGASAFGISDRPSASTTDQLLTNPHSYAYYTDGSLYYNSSVVATYSSFTTGDIISIAFDADNNKLYFAKNGTWQNSADPSAGTNGYTVISPATGNYFFASHDGSPGSSAVHNANFGNPPFAISSGNSDANGYGNFEYAVPSGYYALNTKNLAEFG